MNENYRLAIAFVADGASSVNAACHRFSGGEYSNRMCSMNLAAIRLLRIAAKSGDTSAMATWHNLLVALSNGVNEGLDSLPTSAHDQLRMEVRESYKKFDHAATLIDMDKTILDQCGVTINDPDADMESVSSAHEKAYTTVQHELRNYVIRLQDLTHTGVQLAKLMASYYLKGRTAQLRADGPIYKGTKGPGVAIKEIILAMSRAETITYRDLISAKFLAENTSNYAPGNGRVYFRIMCLIAGASLDGLGTSEANIAGKVHQTLWWSLSKTESIEEVISLFSEMNDTMWLMVDGSKISGIDEDIRNAANEISLQSVICSKMLMPFDRKFSELMDAVEVAARRNGNQVGGKFDTPENKAAQEYIMQNHLAAFEESPEMTLMNFAEYAISVVRLVKEGISKFEHSGICSALIEAIEAQVNFTYANVAISDREKMAHISDSVLYVNTAMNSFLLAHSEDKAYQF